MAKNKNTMIDFRYSKPVALINPATGIHPTAADTQVGNMLGVGDGFLELYQNGASTALLAPVRSAAGVAITLDATDNDGFQLTEGLAANGTAHNFTIGTDPAFYAYLVVKVTDVSNLDNCLFGFRKSAAYVGVTALGTGAGSIAAAYTDYFMAGIHAGNGVNDGKLYQIDGLNDANDHDQALAHAAVTDGQHMAVKVLVDASGNATFKIGSGATVANAESDLAVDASALAFKFDSTDTVIPTLVVVNAAAGDPGVVLVKYECGYQTV